ncbi:hypothetical protein PMAYCL1PPCAC_20801, partial [Pristionchus mayeri]
GKTCYTASQSSTRYEMFGKATVETRRGCEVLCDAESKCAALSFKDAGFNSSCVLLSPTELATCYSPTEIFLKKTTGCVARTNITAEFGVDPCVDETFPAEFRGTATSSNLICNTHKDKLYVIR